MTSLSNPTILAAKAAFGVALALGLVSVFGVSDQISASFVALVCTSPAVFTGIRRGFEQLVASLLGGMVAAAAAALLPHHPATAGLALGIAVAGILHTRWAGGYLVAGFTVIYVYALPGAAGDIVETRLVSVAIGVAASTVVNLATSFLLSDRTWDQRVGIVRGALADALTKTAVGLEDGTDDARGAPIDLVFPVARLLLSELADARQQARLARSRSIAPFIDEVEALSHVAHVAKEIALNADGGAGAAGASLRALSEAVRSFSIPVARDDSRNFARALAALAAAHEARVLRHAKKA